MSGYTYCTPMASPTAMASGPSQYATARKKGPAFLVAQCEYAPARCIVTRTRPARIYPDSLPSSVSDLCSESLRSDTGLTDDTCTFSWPVPHFQTAPCRTTPCTCPSLPAPSTERISFASAISTRSVLTIMRVEASPNQACHVVKWSFECTTLFHHTAAEPVNMNGTVQRRTMFWCVTNRPRRSVAEEGVGGWIGVMPDEYEIRSDQIPRCMWGEVWTYRRRARPLIESARWDET